MKVVSILKKNRDVRGKHSRSVTEVNFKDKLENFQPDAETTILNADCDTTVLGVENLPEDLNFTPPLANDEELDASVEDQVTAAQTDSDEPDFSEEAHEKTDESAAIDEDTENPEQERSSVAEVEGSEKLDLSEDADEEPAENSIKPEHAKVVETAPADEEDKDVHTETSEEAEEQQSTFDDAPGTTVLNFADVRSQEKFVDSEAFVPEQVEVVKQPTVHYSLRHKETAEVFKIEQDNMTVGKSKFSDIQIKNTQTVSRTHMLVHLQDGKLFVEDNNSLNGTFVNNEPLRDHEKREVFAGDVVRLSDEELVVCCEEERA